MIRLNVSCAVILKDEKVFAAQRGNDMSFSGYWEFPGGKVENGESLFDCIVREMREELCMIASPAKALSHIYHDYGEFQIDLYPVLCDVIHEAFELREHENAGWFDREELQQLKWAPADMPIVNQLINGEI
jgi:8-oxo-dGTP diphosphatase